MERAIGAILYGLFYGIGSVLMLLVELPFWFLMNRREKPDALYLPLPIRFEHTHIVAGSGHGKTQLLQHLIVTHDLEEVSKGRRSLVVIDSQGDLIHKILHLPQDPASCRVLPKEFGWSVGAPHLYRPDRHPQPALLKPV